MSSTINDLIPEKYTIEKEKGTYIAGYYGFGIDYLVNVVELDRKDIIKQFLDKSGNDYKIWLHGYYTALTELRATIMSSALSSSTPNIEKMLTYFAETQDELNTLEDE